jgi:hypothetical protein
MSEEFRSAPSYVEIKARTIVRSLDLRPELNEKPGPNGKTRFTSLALKAFRAASMETEGDR